MNKKLAILTISLSIILGSITGYIAFGATTITVDESGRREYGYCPIAPETLLATARLEINGCPLIRTYVINWNSLTPLEQSTIDSQLRALGFKDISEFDVSIR